MNLTKGFNLLSLFKSDGSENILKEIENDFEVFPDLNKVDITIRKAINDQYQYQFDDFLQLNYTFGKFHKKKNTPLAPYIIKRVTINYMPGHEIYIFKHFDIASGKKQHQENTSEIITYVNGKHKVYNGIKFKVAGKFIRKFIDKFMEQYPELDQCKRLNYRGILDVENNIDPIIGFVDGISRDHFDYVYPYRSNEDPVKLFTKFRLINRKDIEEELKKRDIKLYQPVWKKEATRIRNIEKELMNHLKPIYKYCSPMFGVQKYSFEHNDIDMKIKITFKISDVNLFKKDIVGLLNNTPNFFVLTNLKYQGNDIMNWAFLEFSYQ
tara:strand:+ start:2341 stop:3312 length:972 start_codon:yes stop_codon:yes gene_type:complete